ncbi:MAG: hypothetical protein HOE90_16080 [Bacteriovoracaceae bacterium]|nr:hypothetical protein [Bacteriovoracaceae bacterium]
MIVPIDYLERYHGNDEIFFTNSSIPFDVMETKIDQHLINSGLALEEEVQGEDTSGGNSKD